jgi:hypothetical protein
MIPTTVPAPSQGRFDEPCLAGLQKDARRFLVPSRTHGFQFRPLGANVWTVPTAVANSGSLSRVTEERVLVFDPDDSEASNTCLRLMDDEAGG